MKLNNKGFAISTIMYLILVLSVTLIILVLALLSARKLTLDKIRNETENTIYNMYGVIDEEVLNTLKQEAIEYAEENDVTIESIKISDFDTSINDVILYGYDLMNKYLTIKEKGSSYDVYLGREKTITDISKSTTSFVDVLDYKIYGNSKQDTYTGKNLFSGLVKGQTLVPSTTSTLGPFGETYNSSNGAVTDFIEVDFDNYDYYLSGLTDTIYSCVYGYDENYQAVIRTSGSTRKNLLLNESSFKEDFRVSNNKIKYIRITQYEVTSESGTISDIDGLKIQLEKGTTATSYEPYVGGEPAPNPDYPQEIKSVGNKNLITAFTDDYSRTQGGVRYSVTHGEKTITLNGESASSGGRNAVGVVQSISLKSGTKYKFRAYSVGGTAAKPLLGAYLTNKSNTSQYYELKVNGDAITITPSSNITVYTGVNVDEETEFNNYKVAFELYEVEGNTEPDEYDIPVTLSGKNLFDYKSLIGKLVTQNGGTISVNSSGGIVGSGTPTGYVSIKKVLYDISPMTYTFSLTGNYTNIAVQVYLMDINNNSIYNFTLDSYNKQKTLNLRDYSNYNSLSIDIKRATSNVAMSGTAYLQIEKGTTATDYEEFVEPSTTFVYLDEPLRGIDNYRDQISSNNSKTIKNIESRILTGQEQWQNINYNLDNGYIALKLGNSGYGIRDKLYSSIGVQKTINMDTPGIGFNTLNSDTYNDFRLAYRPDKIKYDTYQKAVDTIANSSMPVELDFVLSTPSETTKTLPNISFNGEYNNITIGTNIQPSNVEFTVVEKMQKL